MKDSAKKWLFGPRSNPYGISYPQWTVRWWRWLLSLPKGSNPALDTSGRYSKINQHDPNVWFLAGTFGGIVERICTIPSGRSILMPVINYQCSYAEEPSITTTRGLKFKCKKEIDDIKDAKFMIDESIQIDLSRYRIRSPIFSINLKDNNALDLQSCSTKMTSDGFWVFLKPLAKGRHKIRSFGSCRSGKIMIGVIYDLCVR